MSSMLARFKRALDRPVRGQQIKMTSLNYLRDQKSILFVATLVTTGITYTISERIPQSDIQHAQHHQNKPTNEEYSEIWRKQHRLHVHPVERPDTNRPARLRLRASTPEESKELGSKVLASGTKNGFFIPLSRLRRCETEYFLGSDPEWQEFVKLSKDKKRSDRAKVLLCQLLLAQINMIPAIKDVTGIPLQFSRVWLDFKFPVSPPPEYERLGLIFYTDGGYAGRSMLAYMRYDDLHSRRASWALYPTVLLSSLAAMGQTLVTSHYGSLKSLWTANGGPTDQIPTSGAVPESAAAATIRDQANTNTDANERSKPGTIPGVDPDTSKIISIPGFNTGISNAAKVFKFEFQSRQIKQMLTWSPREGCSLDGEIEFKGPRGYCKLSVRAIYLPRVDKFWSYPAGLQNLQPNSLKPGRPPDPRLNPKT